MYGNAYVVIIFSRTTFIHGGQPKSDQWLSAGQPVFHTLSWTLIGVKTFTFSNIWKAILLWEQNCFLIVFLEKLDFCCVRTPCSQHIYFVRWQSILLNVWILKGSFSQNNMYRSIRNTLAKYLVFWTKKMVFHTKSWCFCKNVFTFETNSCQMQGCLYIQY